MNRVEVVLAVVSVLAFVAWVWADTLYENPQPILGLTVLEMCAFVSFVAVVLLGFVLGIPDVSDP